MRAASGVSGAIGMEPKSSIDATGGVGCRSERPGDGGERYRLQHDQWRQELRIAAHPVRGAAHHVVQRDVEAGGEDHRRGDRGDQLPVAQGWHDRPNGQYPPLLQRRRARSHRSSERS